MWRVTVGGMLALCGLAACQPARAPDIAKTPDIVSAPDLESPAAKVVAPSPVVPAPALFSVSDGQTTLPAPFAGTWDASPEVCGWDYSDMRLVVDAGNMRFWESDGSPTTIEQDGVNAIIVAADFSGEGETWTRKLRMALADAGETLMIDDVKRVRCKGGK